ncbi:hypothetical protein [Actinoplanes subglobosus]|uniref:DUF4352 domain-containing protein n=1 Tax=Actinoplanes subglobosus TaxID=1547892 RepID=A0ABV8IRL1_9ACTN
MTTLRTPRRYGLLALTAVAGVAVGGVLALRAKNRRRAIVPEPDREAPPVVAPRPAEPEPAPAPARRIGPERKLVRMAAGAGVVVVLAIATAIVTGPSSSGGTVTPPLVVTRSPGQGGMYIEVTAPGPVDHDDRVALAGSDGARVEVGITPHIDRTSYDDASQRTVFYQVHLKNTGSVPVIARLDPEAWLLDASGTTYHGDPMRSRMVETNVAGEPPYLEPGWEIDLTLGFDVAKSAELARVHVTLPMAGRPYGEWNLR